MLRVGLTGGLASGKSFVGRELGRLGCAVLQADRLGHRVLADDPAAVSEVAKALGPSVLDSSGAVNRRALASAVFSDASKLELLNAIVHPRVFERMERFFREAEAREPQGVAVVEAAIMIETGSYRRYQRLVLTACPESMQAARYVERAGASAEDARKRIARQMPLADKRRYAHFVIDTSGTEDETLRQAREVYRQLATEAARGGAVSGA